MRLQEGRMRALLASSALILVVMVSMLAGMTTAQKAQRGSSRGAQLVAQARKSPMGIIALSSAKDFDQITATPRDYSLSMLLTAVDSPPINCAPCKAFAPNFEGVAKGYRKAVDASKDKPNHVFVVLEFKDGREIFQRLQATYAPILLFYPATTGPNASPSGGEPETYDFNRIGFEGEDLADDLSKRLNLNIKFRKPFPWRMTGVVASAVLAAAAMALVIIPRLDASVLSVSVIFGWVVKAATMATILLMCAGYMWNGIRGAPFMTTDGQGRPQYFANGFQNQNGAETQIVAVVYGILAFAFTSLTILVPMQRDPVKQRAGVYVWSVILLGGFSLLLYIFRIKNPSYPFRLFF